MSNFPKRLQQARVAAHLTQGQVAAALGISPQAVSQWETGESKPALRRAMKLRYLLGVDWDWLWGGANLTFEEARARGPKDRSKVDFSMIAEIPMLSRRKAAEWVTRYPDLSVEPEIALLAIEEVADALKMIRPHNPPLGVGFGLEIETDSMLPEFQVGDVVVIDTGVPPQPSDYVAALFKGEKRVTFRRLRLRGYDNEGGQIIELMARNPDFPSPLMVAKGHATVENIQARQGRVLGTMVEHRRFRFRSGERRFTDGMRGAAQKERS